MSSSGGKGAGLGLKLLLGAGALAYGIKEATYTGKHTLVPSSQYVTDAGRQFMSPDGTDTPQKLPGD